MGEDRDTVHLQYRTQVTGELKDCRPARGQELVRKVVSVSKIKQIQMDSQTISNLAAPLQEKQGMSTTQSIFVCLEITRNQLCEGNMTIYINIERDGSGLTDRG